MATNLYYWWLHNNSNNNSLACSNGRKTLTNTRNQTPDNTTAERNILILFSFLLLYFADDFYSYIREREREKERFLFIYHE